MVMEKNLFERMVMGKKLDLEVGTESVEVEEGEISGLLIISKPIYKKAAVRLKNVIVGNGSEEGVKVYIEMGDEGAIELGRMGLTFDTFTELNHAIIMYEPEYYIVNGEEVEEFDKELLIDTAKLPTLEQKDYYMT